MRRFGYREALTFVDPTYRGDDVLTAPKHCAYNQTSECFLGLDVDAADFSHALLDERIPLLTPGSGAGLWMTPFRGMSAEQVRIPLDLVYLDESCRVIDVVESFPGSQTASSRRPAASVLALPVNSIQLSQTKPGDQLVLCAAKEMAARLSRVEVRHESWNEPGETRAIEEWAPSGHPIVAPQPASWREEPVASSAVQPAPLKKNRIRGWLERFLAPEQPKEQESSDPRRAPRKLVRDVFAFYWTGSTPAPHAIRDISMSGLYIVTDERWYPETVIRLSLTKTDSRGIERAISVQARVVRWGNDGVGLQFVTPEAPDHNGRLEGEGANREQLDEFLQWIGKARV